MGASAGLMQGTSAGTQGVASIGNAYSQSQALQAQSYYKATAAGINSSLAEIQSEQAIDNGEREASQQQDKAKAIVGQEKADYAGQGVVNNSGSAAHVEATTATMGALDAMTIRNNAAQQAFGYKIAAINATASGQFEQIAGNSAATNTLLTGGMNAVSAGMKSGYYFSQNGKGPIPTYDGGLTVPSADDFSYSGQLGDFH